MERPAHYELATSWRTRALVLAAVAAVELAVLLGVAVVLLGKTLSTEVRDAAEARALAPARTAPKPARTNAAPLARSETSVVVLNGNGVPGAAATTGDRIRALSYVVTSVGNAPRSDYGRSIVMYRPGYRAEAQRLARDLRVSLVGPLDGLRASDLMGAHVAFVLGH